MSATSFAYENIFDSRDVIKRIEELKSDVDNALLDGEVPDEEVAEELRVLEEFAKEAEGYTSEWEDGATFIDDSYFEDYARELADDIGAIPSDASWPLTHIDWEAAADELKQDYTTVELEGFTFYVRSV